MVIKCIIEKFYINHSTRNDIRNYKNGEFSSEMRELEYEYEICRRYPNHSIDDLTREMHEKFTQ